MPVLEFECQLARSQISRYMGGEVLSEDLLHHLGDHVAECPGCRDFLEERRTALRAMLGSDLALAEAAAAEAEKAVKADRSVKSDKASKTPKPKSRQAAPTSDRPITHAVVKAYADASSNAESQPAQPKMSAREMLLSRLRIQQSEAESEPETVEAETAAAPTPKRGLLQLGSRQYSKPAMYSVALAAVLVGMSWMVKSPGGLLGPKALGSSITESAPAAAGAASVTKSDSQATALKPPKSQAQADQMLQAEATDKPAPSTTNSAVKPTTPPPTAPAATGTAAAGKTSPQSTKPATTKPATTKKAADHRPARGVHHRRWTAKSTKAAARQPEKHSETTIHVYNP